MPSGPPVHAVSLMMTIEMMMPRPERGHGQVVALQLEDRPRDDEARSSAGRRPRPPPSRPSGGQPKRVVRIAEA